MTSLLEVTILGLILSADSFSAAVALGSRRFSTSKLLKFAVASSVAEALATLIGDLAGEHVISMISDYDHWIAFGLLAAVALHMAVEGIQGLRNPGAQADPSVEHGLLKILVVSLATSMDAFGVGIGLGLTHRPVWPFVGAIAAWAFVLSIAGVYIGNSMSRKMGPVFSLFAAAVLGYLSTQMLKI